MSNTILKIIVVSIITLISAFLIRITNIKKDMRVRQVVVSMMTPFVMLITVIVVYIKYDSLVINTLNDFFDGMIIVWNIVILGVFLAYKLILDPICKAILSKNNLLFIVAGRYYEYNASVNKWFLKQSYKNVRTLMNVLSWIATALGIIVLSVNWIVGEESDWYMQVFPFAAMIIITEFYNFLAGYTQPEYERLIQGEDISFHKKRAYYKLRRVYEELFPSALLVSHTGNEYLGKEGSTNKLENMSKFGTQIEKEVGDYFLHLDRKRGSFDTDLIDVTTALMNKKNVVIQNPFYRDLSDYLLLPIVSNSIYDKKCLVITGRSNNKDDIIDWLNNILFNYGKTQKLWRVANLERFSEDCEIGVMSFSQLYDTDVIRANRGFFGRTGFILLLEPSKMLCTAQVGLNIIAEYIFNQNDATLCVLDRNIDGLVDTLSHIFKSDITTVIAPPVPRSVYTAMAWNANGDFKRQKMFNKETRYLADGIEIAAVALKNQIPHVSWYSTEKAPIEDIKWIAGQYYPQITRYANLQNQQHYIEERILFETNLWGSNVSQEDFVIVEDEFCNVFETLRMFLTRGMGQSFVNVISENYILRDYMRYNWQVFMTDTKAIPTFCVNYAKTERNTVLKLILMMAETPIDENIIIHEFELLGIKVEDLYSQLMDLIGKYLYIDETIISVKNRQMPGDDLLPERKREYYISKETYNKYFSATIKNAYFVVEDEETDSTYIDARLFGHITQIVMPNQIVVYNGKAYRVHKCTPEMGCILRRASDSYTNRFYYRQLRNYHFSKMKEIVSARTVYDIDIIYEKWDFSVDSTGYLELKDNNDLRTAKIIDLSDDPSIGNYKRKYKNKNILKLLLPDTTKDVRLTFSILLLELFRTIYPDAWPYLAVVSDYNYDDDGMLSKYVYHLDGTVDENAVYIVEDSDIDLGLLESIDSNIIRIFEILEDYLEWHFDKMKEPRMSDPILDRIVLDEEDLKIKETFAERLARRFKTFFGIGKSVKETYVDSQEEPVVAVHKEAEKTNKADLEPKEKLKKNKPGDLGDEDLNAKKKTDIKSESDISVEFELYKNKFDKKREWLAFDKDQDNVAEGKVDVDVLIDDSEKIKVNGGEEAIKRLDMLTNELELVMPIEPSRYQKECYLNLGFDEIDGRLDIERVRAYLGSRGLGNNHLTKARRRKRFEDNILDFNAENYCDFCGKPLSGVSYDILADGRIRCNDCSTTAILDLEEFKAIYHHTEMMMENIFEIIYPIAIAIHTADAQKLAKHAHSVYTPSKQFASRVMGYAQYKSGEYTIFIENGCPKLVALNLIAHEMTHIWQYINWKQALLESIYRQDNPERDKVALDLVYEGMAVWTSIQILYSMGETFFAEEQEQGYLAIDIYDKENVKVRRQDVYGYGYYLYRERFHLETAGDVPPYSPFKTFPPLDPDKVRKIVLILCPDKD